MTLRTRKPVGQLVVEIRCPCQKRTEVGQVTRHGQSLLLTMFRPPDELERSLGKVPRLIPDIYLLAGPVWPVSGWRKYEEPVPEHVPAECTRCGAKGTVTRAELLAATRAPEKKVVTVRRSS